MSASVERVSLIYTALERRGDGLRDPIRIVEQYWTDAGELVAEKDPAADKFIDDVRTFLGTVGNDTSRVFGFDGYQVTIRSGDHTK